MTANLKQLVLAEARAAGFDAARVTTPSAIDPRTGQRLADFLQEGRHGDMEWMANTAERRRHPVSMWPETRSIVMLGMNYAPAGDPLAAIHQKGMMSFISPLGDVSGFAVLSRGARPTTAKAGVGTQPTRSSRC